MAGIDLEGFVGGDYNRVVRVVSLVTGDLDVAADAVQEALTRAMESTRRGKEIHNLPAWVTVVALNVSRRRFRRRKHERSLLPVLPFRPTDPGEHEPGLEVHRAIRSLPLRQRQVIVLHHLMDLDVVATARLLGVSDGTVKSALSRGRASLECALAPLMNAGEGEAHE